MNLPNPSTDSDPDPDSATGDGLTWFVRGLVLLGLLVMTLVLYRQGFSTGSPGSEPAGTARDSVSGTERFKKTNPVLKKRSGAWEDRPGEVRRLLRRLGVVPVQPEPDFAGGEMVDLEGRTHRLRDLRNHWVLVNFWATWCPPCREEMPSLERLSRRLSDRSFRLVTIDVEEKPGRVASFLERQDLEVPVWIDATGEVSDSFAVSGLPVSWILTPEGDVMGRIRGPREWDRDPALSLFQLLTRDRSG